MRRREVLARRNEQLTTILHVAAQWNQTHQMVPLLEQMATAATRLLKADRASIFLWDKHNRTLVGRPALGVNNGQVAVAWYEKPFIKFSVVNDGGPVLPPSSILRMHEIQYPRPSISAGATNNEWYMTWQDSDQPKGTPEIYATRITCR